MHALPIADIRVELAEYKQDIRKHLLCLWLAEVEVLRHASVNILLDLCSELLILLERFGGCRLSGLSKSQSGSCLTWWLAWRLPLCLHGRSLDHCLPHPGSPVAVRNACEGNRTQSATTPASSAMWMCQGFREGGMPSMQQNEGQHLQQLKTALQYALPPGDYRVTYTA